MKVVKPIVDATHQHCGCGSQRCRPNFGPQRCSKMAVNVTMCTWYATDLPFCKGNIIYFLCIAASVRGGGLCGQGREIPSRFDLTLVTIETYQQIMNELCYCSRMIWVPNLLYNSATLMMRRKGSEMGEKCLLHRRRPRLLETVCFCVTAEKPQKPASAGSSELRISPKNRWWRKKREWEKVQLSKPQASQGSASVGTKSKRYDLRYISL